VESELSNVK